MTNYSKHSVDDSFNFLQQRTVHKHGLRWVRVKSAQLSKPSSSYFSLISCQGSDTLFNVQNEIMEKVLEILV